jgi:hypothetical protein
VSEKDIVTASVRLWTLRFLSFERPPTCCPFGLTWRCPIVRFVGEIPSRDNNATASRFHDTAMAMFFVPHCFGATCSIGSN